MIAIKQNDKALSKHVLTKLIGANHNSIQRWGKMYERGGIDGLLPHKDTASAPFMFTVQEREKITILILIYLLTFIRTG